MSEKNIGSLGWIPLTIISVLKVKNHTIWKTYLCLGDQLGSESRKPLQNIIYAQIMVTKLFCKHPIRFNSLPYIFLYKGAQIYIYCSIYKSKQHLWVRMSYHHLFCVLWGKLILEDLEKETISHNNEWVQSLYLTDVYHLVFI